MKQTYSSQRSSRERITEHSSGRNGNIRSRSPIRRNRQRHSNSRDRSPIENRRQIYMDTHERPTWNDSRSYASSCGSDQQFLDRQYERERNISRSPVICKFYNNEGKCKRADSCTYLHLCRHYILDSCKFGRICKRSHDIRDRQPKQILKQYGIIPDSTKDEYDIVRFIKERLSNGNLKSKGHTISKTNLESPLLRPVNVLDNVSETSSLYEPEEDYNTNSHKYGKGANEVRREQLRDSLDLYASDTRQCDDPGHSSQSEVDTSVDYIPLERKVKKKPKRVGTCRKMKVHGDDKKSKKNKKKDESQHKMKDCKVETVDAPEEGSVNNGAGEMIPDQSTMKFELQNGSQHFQVRNATGRFQIAPMSGPWNDMNVTDSEIFNQLYHSAVQIGQRFLPKS